MIIEQSVTVHAPVQTVWDFMFDVERSSRCVPGLERVTVLDERHYEGAINVKVGPVAARFEGQAEIAELEPPASVVVKGQAKDTTSASSALGTAKVELRPIGEDQTEVSYSVDMAVGGTLGRFGQGIVREVARRMAEEAVRCVEAELSQRPPSAAPQSTATQPPRGPGAILRRPAPAVTALEPIPIAPAQAARSAPARLPSFTITIEVQPDRIIRYSVVGLIALLVGFVLGYRSTHQTSRLMHR